jgi:hypothetical protein
MIGVITGILVTDLMPGREIAVRSERLLCALGPAAGNRSAQSSGWSRIVTVVGLSGSTRADFAVAKFDPPYQPDL